MFFKKEKKNGRLTYLSMVVKHNSMELGSSFKTSDLKQKIWSLASSILQPTCVMLSELLNLSGVDFYLIYTTCIYLYRKNICNKLGNVCV